MTINNEDKYDEQEDDGDAGDKTIVIGDNCRHNDDCDFKKYEDKHNIILKHFAVFNSYHSHYLLFLLKKRMSLKGAVTEGDAARASSLDPDKESGTSTTNLDSSSSQAESVLGPVLDEAPRFRHSRHDRTLSARERNGSREIEYAKSTAHRGGDKSKGKIQMVSLIYRWYYINISHSLNYSSFHYHAKTC